MNTLTMRELWKKMRLATVLLRSTKTPSGKVIGRTQTAIFMKKSKSHFLMLQN